MRCVCVPKNWAGWMVSFTRRIRLKIIDYFHDTSFGMIEMDSIQKFFFYSLNEVDDVYLIRDI